MKYRPDMLFYLVYVVSTNCVVCAYLTDQTVLTKIQTELGTSFITLEKYFILTDFIRHYLGMLEICTNVVRREKIKYKQILHKAISCREYFMKCNFVHFSFMNQACKNIR